MNHMDGDDIIKAAASTIPDTDDADPRTVLAVVRFCAASWVPEARIIGNVRAGDIVRAIDSMFVPKGCSDEVEVIRTKIAQAVANGYDPLDQNYVRREAAIVLAELDAANAEVKWLQKRLEQRETASS
jgi:ubiquinone biosynthesis protein UbiJ